MYKILKKFSWSLFIVIFLCFTMPFITVSCKDNHPMKWGNETPKDDSKPDIYSGTQIALNFIKDGIKFDQNLAPAIAFIFSFVGSIIFFAKNTMKAILGETISILGFICLMIFKIVTDIEIKKMMMQNQ